MSLEFFKNNFIWLKPFLNFLNWILFRNGNNIFIPAAGYFDDNHNSFYNEGSDGDVWSSSVESNSADNAYYLDFYSGGCSRVGYYRCYGFSVRGVCK